MLRFDVAALSGLFFIFFSSWISQIQTLVRIEARVEAFSNRSEMNFQKLEKNFQQLEKRTNMRFIKLESDLKEIRMMMQTILSNQTYGTISVYSCNNEIAASDPQAFTPEKSSSP